MAANLHSLERSPDRERQRDPSLPTPEIVLGLVAPAGANQDAFQALLEASLKEFGYKSTLVRFSALATELVPEPPSKDGSREFVRLTQLMDAGNEARKIGGGDALALAALLRGGNGARGPRESPFTFPAALSPPPPTLRSAQSRRTAPNVAALLPPPRSAHTRPQG